MLFGEALASLCLPDLRVGRMIMLFLSPMADIILSESEGTSFCLRTF